MQTQARKAPTVGRRRVCRVPAWAASLGPNGYADDARRYGPPQAGGIVSPRWKPANVPKEEDKGDPNHPGPPARGAVPPPTPPEGENRPRSSTAAGMCPLCYVCCASQQVETSPPSGPFHVEGWRGRSGRG